MKIIMFIFFIPILPIVYFVLRNEVKAKKNIILGVTLPYRAREDVEVLALCNSFKKQLNILSIVLLSMPIITLLFRHTSVIFTFYMLWLIFAIILPYVPYTIYHQKLKRLKIKNHWSSNADTLALADIKVAVMTKKQISVVWFIPPIIMSLIPIIYTIINPDSRDVFWWMLLIYFINAFLVAIFYFIYRSINNQRTEIIDEDTTLGMALTRVRRYNWGKCWIWTAWLTGIFNLLFWIFMYNTFGIIILSSVYSLVLLVIIMRAEFATRNAQYKMSKESGKTVFLDEDTYWINGMFYYNSHNKRLMINERTGMGMTVNLAHLAGKILMGIAAICIIAMPFIGFWMISEEFTPVNIEINETQLIAYHISEVYEINLEDIQSVELLNALPKTTKLIGTAFDTLYKGKFKVTGIGTCELCLNPKAPLLIMIRTTDKNYILSEGNSKDTLEIYSKLED